MMNIALIKFYLELFESHQKTKKSLEDFDKKLRQSFVLGDLPEQEYKILREITLSDLKPSSTTVNRGISSVKGMTTTQTLADGCSRVGGFYRSSGC